MRLTIRWKLILGFMVSNLILLSACGIAVFKMDSMGQIASEINDSRVPSLAMLGEMNGDVADIERMTLYLMNETDPRKVAEAEEMITNRVTEFEEDMKGYPALIRGESEQRRFDEFLKSWSNFTEHIPNIIAAVKAGDAGVEAREFEEAHSSFTIASQAIISLIEINKREADLATDDSVALYKSGRSTTVFLSIAAVIIAALIAGGTSWTINRSLTKVREQVQRVAEGDLTAEPLVLRNKDELSDLADNVNQMASQLHSLIRQISLSSHQVVATSEELSASAEQTSHTAEMIATSIQNVASGADDQLQTVIHTTETSVAISQGMEQISVSIDTVSDASTEAVQRARVGNDIVKKTVAQMNMLNEKVTASAEVVTALGKKSQEIEQIVGLITQIASQTNLLALNAAIEAARAGEQGRGFAVVADEVRKLAEQSSQSASQISELIAEVQAEVNKAISAMDEGTDAVREGLSYVHETGQAFDEIMSSIFSVSNQTGEVYTVVEQVNTTTQQLVIAIEGIAKVSEQASTHTQEIAAAAEEQNATMEEITAASNMLAKMAEELQEAVGTFKV
ncbi:methyl-accepting chemotaxis protein [Brevibacillus dissolubilis]|uniref:methyl-accepting chemotaxis protein n=1 Tax=Brevibacillus dissolubilis TaxID=1844116 RepID=UPI00159BE776|nr:HAMP domain-containing methyl-accepting chemotaxis protein [Brevibacillus dissolubilis]